MPRVLWPLLFGRPKIEVVFQQARGPIQATRDLLADTGAGSDQASFELALDEADCRAFGGQMVTATQLGGAYSGSFPVFRLRVQVRALGFDRRVFVVGVKTAPAGFDGIAGFRFLNRFTYGNFGDPGQFGLET